MDVEDCSLACDTAPIFQLDDLVKLSHEDLIDKITSEWNLDVPKTYSLRDQSFLIDQFSQLNTERENQYSHLTSARESSTRTARPAPNVQPIQTRSMYVIDEESIVEESTKKELEPVSQYCMDKNMPKVFATIGEVKSYYYWDDDEAPAPMAESNNHCDVISARNATSANILIDDSYAPRSEIDTEHLRYMTHGYSNFSRIDNSL